MQLPEDVLGRFARLAESEGLELVATEVAGPPGRRVVRLVLDRAEGGVTLADCELVSRQVSVLLDAHDPISERYTLEVTSPGLDRKLYGERDYQRFAGEVVRVRMQPGWRGNRVITGVLQGLTGGDVRILTDGGEVVVPLSGVLETRLHPFAGDEAGNNRRRKRN